MTAERDRINEVLDYGLLAQNNEASALSIETIETHAGLVVDEVAAETENKKVKQVKDIRNSDFYVIKLVFDDAVIHAVKKVDASWGTKRARNVISVMFREQQLELYDAPSFDIARNVDFFIVDDEILISQKTKFESCLSYKAEHIASFASLQQETEFAAIFSDMTPIISYVGDNKIQLRRAAAIRQKGHYRNTGFMMNLRQKHGECGLNIQFDGSNRIVPTPETCRDIFQALLDHRLSSVFSDNIYDVPDAVSVAV